jgi:hypothetical protein
MTKTQNEYAEQCREENPKMVEIINGVERELTQEEHDKAVKAWALMRWQQDNPDHQTTNEQEQVSQ